MRRRKQFLGNPADDRGAALLLVLVVVTVVALAGAALLSFSDTSLRTTVALRGQGAAAYAAEGAAQVAINGLSAGHGFTSPAWFNNANNTTCFGPNTTSGTLNLPGFYPGLNGTAPSSASVVCTADPETGVNGTVVPITSANRPGQAIMTLGRVTGEDGVNSDAQPTKAVAVKGAVKSNSNIRVVSGTLQSTAAVTAFGACTGSIVSTPSASCPTGTSLADPFVAAPTLYVSDATTVPTYQDVPACSIGVVKFYAGYYDDAKALTTLMDSTGACAGRTWWFTPGTYYFDFHNNTDDPDVYRGAATGSGRTANQWAITSGNLVAGTPVDSNGTVIGSPGGSPMIPGSCQNPLRSTTNNGVQFIFGGDSQLALGGSAKAEICGTYHNDRPPIALYGARSGAATTTTLTGTGSGPGAALKMSAFVSSVPFPFANPTRVIEQDNSSATWAKAGSTSQTSTITVSGYAPPAATPIPAGSIVKSATVRVRHGNSRKYKNGTGKDKVTVTVTPKGVTGSGTPITWSPILGTTSKGLVSDPPVDIYSGGTSGFVQYVHENGFTGADVAYAATLTHTGTESLDDIQIDISYVTPAFRAENISTISGNCMRAVYTRAPGTACAVLSTSVSALGAFTGAFYLQGTTYAPLAAVDLTLANATQQVLRFGAISRSLWVKENASFSYPGPVVEIPDDTAGDNGAPIVFLTVYVCPATTTSSCSSDAGAITALRVKARIIDATPPSKMTILSWSNLR